MLRHDQNFNYLIGHAVATTFPTRCEEPLLSSGSAPAAADGAMASFVLNTYPARQAFTDRVSKQSLGAIQTQAGVEVALWQ